MKKRIMFATPYGTNDTTSFLRAHGAFSLMPDLVEPVYPPSHPLDWWRDWSQFRWVDCVYMHRPSNPSAYGIMQVCKQMRIPLWVDHDDDLLAVTPDNPHFLFFNKQGVKEAVEFSYKEADILTCSGEIMYKELKEKWRPDVIHIQTGIDDKILFMKQDFKKNTKVGWRGSKSHQTDLLFFQDQIIDNMEKSRECRWYFWGINPYWLDFFGKYNIKWCDELNLYDYLMAITTQNCSIHMVPLVDTHFNRVKSNLSWLDATLAGSAVLGPKYPEFERPGVIHYENPKEFAARLSNMINGDIDLQKHHDESWKYIQDNLITSKLNEKRREILKNL